MAGFGGFGMMRPLGQMWSQPQMGQMHPLGSPQMGQGTPTGQFPLNPMGQQQMTPGGGSTGAPLQMGQMPLMGQNPGYQMPQQGMLPNFQVPVATRFDLGMQDWRQQRPTMGPALQAWRQARPQYDSY